MARYIYVICVLLLMVLGTPYVLSNRFKFNSVMYTVRLIHNVFNKLSIYYIHLIVSVC